MGRPSGAPAANLPAVRPSGAPAASPPAARPSAPGLTPLPISAAPAGVGSLDEPAARCPRCQTPCLVGQLFCRSCGFALDLAPAETTMNGPASFATRSYDDGFATQHAAGDDDDVLVTFVGSPPAAADADGPSAWPGDRGPPGEGAAPARAGSDRPVRPGNGASAGAHGGGPGGAEGSNATGPALGGAPAGGPANVHTRPTVNVRGGSPVMSVGGSNEGATLATPQASPQGRLLVYRHDSTEGAPVPLQASPFDIGGRDGHLRLDDDPYVSPLHARLVLEGGRWYMVDLGSLNGVYRRLAPSAELGDGDLILLGQQVLRFELVMDAERALRPAYQHGVALFGTPPGARFARLCQRTVEGVTRDVVHMGRDELTLGREGTDLAFPDDAFLSRRHAVIRRDASNERFTLEDLGSSNGTFVALRGRVPVQSGDVFRLGLHLVRVEVAEPAGANGGRGPGGRGGAA